jgi:cytosine permease
MDIPTPKGLDTAIDPDFSAGPVPSSSRRGFWSLLVVMLGFTFFSASMWSGGKLGLGMHFGEFALAIALGNLLLGAYAALLAHVATKTGLSTHLLARYAFGRKGSFLASALLAFTQVGWFGVGVAMFALPVEKVTGLRPLLITLVAGPLMISTAYFGIRALTALSFVAVPAIAVLGLVSLVSAVNEVGGLAALTQREPKEALGFSLALTLTVGSFISGATLTPDFARFNSSSRNAIVTSFIAFFIGNGLMFLFGGVGALATGEADISEVMLKQGLIFFAILVLGLNIWTTNDNALYASGLGFSNITGIPKAKLVLVNGVVGTLLAIWLYNNFVSFLSLLSTTLPPIGAIILADYFLVHRGRYAAFDEAELPAVRWQALAAWAVGVAAAHLPGVPPLNGLLAAAVAHTVLCRVTLRAPVPSPALVEERR